MNDERWTRLHDAADVTDEVLDAVEEIIDGWYEGGDVRIDWQDVIDRADGTFLADGTRLDMGGAYDTPAINRIKRDIRKRLASGR